VSNKNKKINKPQDILSIIDDFFQRKSNLFFWIFFVLNVIFTILLFNLKVSVGGDDANYIIRAYDFINSFKYPAFQGPLYPMVLSLAIKIFGINLPILKLLSALFLFAHFYLFFKTFKSYVPQFALFATIILIAINPYLLFYGSQTYSEAFFMLLQIMFFLFFFKKFISEDIKKIKVKQQIIRYLYLGLFVFVLGLTKSVGNIALVAIIIYFAFEKQWKSIVFSVISFIGIFGLWKIIKTVIWSSTNTQFSSQIKVLLQKHPYDIKQGQETFIGFIGRLIDNSNLYLSKHILKLFGLVGDVGNAIPIVTVIIVIILIASLFFVFKNNKYLWFTGIYLASMFGFTFIILQTIWESTRLIIAYFPFLVLFIFSGVYYILKSEKLKSYQIILPVLFVFLFFSTFKRNTEKIKIQRPILKENLSGNKLAGLTPDWVNYIKMCKWAAKNVPEGEKIAARKPSIAFIHTNRRFHGIYKVGSENADTLLKQLDDYKVKYVIMASLRKYERIKTKETINTIERYLYHIQQKYPKKIKGIYKIGSDEPAYLYKIE